MREMDGDGGWLSLLMRGWGSRRRLERRSYIQEGFVWLCFQVVFLGYTVWTNEEICSGRG